MSLLLIYKISRLFPNTPSADCKYSLLNGDNLTQPIQMQLSQKKETFFEFFSAFFGIFKKKGHLQNSEIGVCISEIRDS